MSAESSTSLVSKIAQLIKASGYEPELKLLIIDVASQVNENMLAELVELMENYNKDSAQDENQLKNTLVKIKKSYQEKTDQLEQSINQDLSQLQGQVAEAEQVNKINEIKQSITDK